MYQTIKGVNIGDIFTYKKQTAQVIDICEVKSIATKQIIKHICFCKCITGLAHNTFEIPFSTVAINKIK
jgi:hypothetical protein